MWDWLKPAAAWASVPFTGGATLPIAIGASAGYGLSKIGGHGGGDGNGAGQADAEGHPEDPYTQLLAGQAGKLQKTGTDFTAEGQDALGPAVKYLKGLLSDNGGDVMDATRGQRRRVIDQFDTARQATEKFGPRGGGMTSALAGSRFDQAESLADITSSARRDALSIAASLGPQLAGLGLTAQQLASADLDSVIRSLFSRESLDVEKRGQNMQLWAGIGEAAGTVIGGALGGGGGS